MVQNLSWLGQESKIQVAEYLSPETFSGIQFAMKSSLH